MAKQKKFLIAPLNWGLGHATRCIPIINELLAKGADVQLASDGVALALLQKEFPYLKSHELPAYNIQYPFDNMVLSMAVQSHKILRGCAQEHIWLKRFLQRQNIDIVISDNRFGFFNATVKSIFMTHQLNIKAPFSVIVDFVNAFFIKKFDVCWIPDFENQPNLSGTLGHGGLAKLLNIKYLGALSRMQYAEKEKKYKAIFVLSGPEPQRTIFENIILKQLKTLNVDTPPLYVLVRGLPQATNLMENTQNTIIYNYLTTKDLNEKILESEVLITRSGYSTIMDLANLGAKAVLIPTPGQTEQEYLAQNLMKNNIFFSQSQSDFNILKALKSVESYTGFGKFEQDKDTLNEIITELLKF